MYCKQSTLREKISWARVEDSHHGCWLDLTVELAQIRISWQGSQGLSQLGWLVYMSVGTLLLLWWCGKNYLQVNLGLGPGLCKKVKKGDNEPGRKCEHEVIPLCGLTMEITWPTVSSSCRRGFPPKQQSITFPRELKPFLISYFYWGISSQQQGRKQRHSASFVYHFSL